MQRTFITLWLGIVGGLCVAPLTGEAFWKALLADIFQPQRPQQTVSASPPVTFTHGIASGDVGPFSAVLWTRLDQEVDLLVEVSTEDHFPRFKTLRRRVVTSADNDFTAKVHIAPLLPDQTYYYRWQYGASQSDVGSFKTPPLPVVPTDVRFAFSGDSDGTKDNDGNRINDFEVFEAARQDAVDFFVYLGDTIVSDSVLRTPAMTLDDYRAVYKENRAVANLRNLLKDTSIYAIWDDHEVVDNYAGQTVDAERYAHGREAFLEYMPIHTVHVPDPACAGDPLFRVFHWGKDVDIIILDERSCRNPSVEDVCKGDLAPTLPEALRTQLGEEFQVPISPQPPDGCLQAIFDPARTMLGHRQKALLKAALLLSPARFKFVINEVPIQQFYALPYDRWEGYGFERAEILAFIRFFGIDNVIFLSADFHGNLINDVFIDRFLAPAPVAVEFVTGPIADLTVTKGLDANLIGAFNILLRDVLGVQCSHLDAFSYGLVEVNAKTDTATITLKDDRGKVLLDEQTKAPCTRDIGP